MPELNGRSERDGPEVSVVVVAHNGTDLLRECLDAVFATRAAHSREVVVVDNASGQATRDLLDSYGDRIVLDPAPDNLGYGRGCNRGVALSRGRVVVLLNPDAVVAKGCIDALVDAVDARPGAGLVGGQNRTPDGAVQRDTGWGAPTLWSWFCFATGLSTIASGHRHLDPEAMRPWPPGEVIRPVPIVSGCLLAMTRGTWEALGGFDSTFFMYGEDADLSLRARRAGWRPVLSADARIRHTVGGTHTSTAAKNVMLYTGKAHLARRTWSGARLRLALGLLFCGVLLRSVPELHRGEGRYLPLVRDRRWLAGWSAEAEQRVRGEVVVRS